MRTLAIDIETYGSVDLAKSGVYRYAEAGNFEILLFGYAFDDEPAQVIDLAKGAKLPGEVLSALSDPRVIKTAFNANFERTCLAKYLNKPMPPEEWHCTMAHALYLGLPASLEDVARCLKLATQKMKEGKNLIRYFSLPCKPTKANGGRLRNLPEHDPEKWEIFKAYCRQDVEVERAIRKKLDAYPMPEKERKLWTLDQKINDYGVRIDKALVKRAIECDAVCQNKLFREAVSLTGLENPNSLVQLKGWLEKQGAFVANLSKEKVEELLKESKDPLVKKALRLRQELSKTSVKKYEAMERAVCKDERIRGLLQYYGANRTGRFAGRLVQIHNVPRNDMKDLSLARKLLKAGNYEALELLFDSVPDVLSQLIRTAFIPSPGNRFIAADFSAIEARVIAWLAGEKWRMDVFNTHGKIYEASAAQMFKVPIDAITKGSPLRQKGKIAELACGFGGGKGALINMGAVKMGLNEEELPGIIEAWRKSNPNIVKLWWDVEKAAITAVKERTVVTMQYELKFFYKGGVLFIQLPSGRNLAYIRPRLKPDERFNKETLTYDGIEQGTKQWGRLKTYGPKIVENIVQAIARDCLAEAMLRLDEAGYKIAFHVHDEAVLDAPQGFGSVKEVAEIMSRPIDWAPGLPLRAEAFETEFYKKE